MSRINQEITKDVEALFLSIVALQDEFSRRKKGGQFRGMILALKDVFPEAFVSGQVKERYTTLLRPVAIQAQEGAPRVFRGGRRSGEPVKVQKKGGCDGCGDNVPDIYGDDLAELEDELKARFKDAPDNLRSFAQSEYGVEVPGNLKKVSTITANIIKQLHERL